MKNAGMAIAAARYPATAASYSGRHSNGAGEMFRRSTM